MANIIIAYNNDNADALHRFFESCADEIRQKCANHSHYHQIVRDARLNHQEITNLMQNHQICFIATHGDDDGVYNESGNYVIATSTTNYSLAGKAFYSVACRCGNNLAEHLLSIGVKLFVGYNDDLTIGADEPTFVTCAVSGLHSILEGKTFGFAKQAMLQAYDKAISNATNTDKLFLLRNRESLVFKGDETITITHLP